jgi:hypothetical protein
MLAVSDPEERTRIGEGSECYRERKLRHNVVRASPAWGERRTDPTSRTFEPLRATKFRPENRRSSRLRLSRVEAPSLPKFSPPSDAP